MQIDFIGLLLQHGRHEHTLYKGVGNRYLISKTYILKINNKVVLLK